MARPRKRRRVARRIILWAILLLALYQLIGGYAPFMRVPELSTENARLAEARADEMSHDIATGDRATILETRPEALNERLRLIHRAEREVVITTYDCRDSESARDILCVALERADAGVRVRMLVDGMTGLVNMRFKPLFLALAAHPNIELRLYNPPGFFTPWRHLGRMHDKYVIVDDMGYILGGRNMFDHFLGEYISPSGTYSDDREALVYNSDRSAESSIFQVRDYFEAIWASPDTRAFDSVLPVSEAQCEEILDGLRARCDALMLDRPELFDESVDYADLTLPTDGIWLISNPINFDAKQPTVFAQLTALMARAEDGVVIHSPYAVLNDWMLERLSGLAGQVPVTLMINAVENGANVVASSDYLRHRGEVIGTGMRVLEYAGGNSYHGKSIAIDDDIAVIGSYNLDLRSTYVDTELMLVIRSKDVNALLRSHMDALHAGCRRVIDADTAEVPDGLDIPPLSEGKKIALRLLGGAMQLVRNTI